MGLFSRKTPSFNLPQIKIPTAEEIMQAYVSGQQSYAPQAFGAREGALTDLSKGTSFYEGFQPTSIEQALGNQYFQNIIPNADRSIMHALSLAGIESSPILAEQMAKIRGDVGYNVGSFLSNQGNERARYSLSSRLGIDPFANFGQYADTAINQSSSQANYQIQQAMAEYQNAMNKYNRHSGLLGSLGSILGGVGGFFAGGPAGAALGAGLGGAASSIFGGTSPISLGDSFSAAGYLNPNFGNDLRNRLGGYGRGMPSGTINAGNYSVLPVFGRG